MEASEDQPNATPTRRRRRLTDEQTRQRMLAAASELVRRQSGLTVSLNHLSYEEVIADAGVARSAAYRIWQYKEDFWAEVTVQLAEVTHPSSLMLDQLATRQAVDVLKAHVDMLETPEGRHWLLVEMCRQGATRNFESVSAAPDWRTFVALAATLSSTADPALYERIQTGLRASELAYRKRMADFYELMTRVLGYRLVVEFPGGWEDATSLGGAIVQGLALNGVVMPGLGERSFTGDPFGTGHEATWTMAAFGFTATLARLVEPDAAYSPAVGREVLEQNLTGRTDISLRTA